MPASIVTETPVAPVAPVAPSNPILDAAKGAATKLATKAEVSVAKQEQITADTLSASGVIQESIKEEGRNAEIVANVANVANLNAQNKAIAAFEAAGGVEFQTQLMSAFVESGKELIKANEEREKTGESFTASFVDILRDSVGMSTAVSRAEEAEDRRDDIGETIVGINAAQESITRSLLSTRKTINTATIEASANILKEQVDIKAAKAQLDGLTLNSAALARSMSMSSTDVQAKIKLVELQNTAVNQAAREKEFQRLETVHEQRLIEWTANSKMRAAALEKAELDLSFAKDPKTIALRVAVRDKAFADMQDLIAFEASFISNVQKGQAALGLTIETAAEIKRLGMNATGLKEKAYYKKLRLVGGREGDFGQSPADALETISTTGTNPDLPAARMLISFNQGYLSSLGREKIPKTQQLYNQAFDAYVKPLIVGMKEEIKSGDTTNIFHAPPMAELVGRVDVQASKLFKVVLEPMKMKEFNDKRIYDAAVAGIASKDITSEEAVLGLETLFNAAVDHNNESKMFARAGITPQTSYISRIIPTPFLSTAVATPLRVGVGVLTAGAAVPGFAARAFIGVPPIPLTDNTDPTQIRNAIARLIAASTPTTFFGAELKGASPFQNPLAKGEGE